MSLLLAGRLLLGNRGAAWSFARARVRMGSLTAHRQRATMSQASVTSDVHQSLDIHLNAFAQIALDLALHFQNTANAAQLVFGQILDARVEIYVSFLEDRVRPRAANAVNVRETNLGSFIRW